MRCFEAEAFSRTVVETMHGELDIFRGDGFEAHFLGEELADEAIHIFVGAAFPGGIGMSEEEICIELPGDTLMLGKFLSVVGRQRMWRPRAICANAGSKRRRQGDHGIRDRLSGLERHVGNQRVARRALVNRDECLFLSSTDDQVRLPVAKAGTLGHDGGAQIDGHTWLGIVPRRSRPP